MEHAAAGTGQMAYNEAHRGGLGQHRQGQVLCEPQDQQHMPPSTAQALAGHGEGSDF